jgi:hypothetical protein
MHYQELLLAENRIWTGMQPRRTNILVEDIYDLPSQLKALVEAVIHMNFRKADLIRV